MLRLFEKDFFDNYNLFIGRTVEHLEDRSLWQTKKV